MTSSDFFYFSVALGIWILVIILGFLTYQVIRLITVLRKTVEDLNLEYKTVKSGIKLGTMALLNRFLGKKKGGGNN